MDPAQFWFQQQAGGAQIGNSLRFRGNQELQQSFSASSGQRQFTLSLWTKRTRINNNSDMAVFSAANNGAVLYFNDDNIGFYDYNGGGGNYSVRSTAKFRDPSAWMHIVLVRDTPNPTDSERYRIYVNGARIALNPMSYGWPPQNHQGAIGSRDGHFIGHQRSTGGGDPGRYLLDYLAELHLVNDQALAPTGFGEVDPTTGSWRPKKYTGSHGTNGFYLDFSDPANIGKDRSGNGNDFSPSNFQLTNAAGTDYDWMKDSPTNNYCTYNFLDHFSGIIDEANLRVGNVGAGHFNTRCTIELPRTADVYWEGTVEVYAGNNSQVGIGVARPSANNTSRGDIPGIWCGGGTAGVIPLYKEAQALPVPAGIVAAGATMQIAYQGSTGKMWFGVDNKWFDGAGGATGNPSGRANETMTTTMDTVVPWANVYANGIRINFGQRPFKYTPPTGFKELCTANLPDPIIKKPSTVMDVALWTGDGVNNRQIASLNFSPDLVWIKARSRGHAHFLYDTTRGAGVGFIPSRLNGDIPSDVNGYISAFNANGFALTQGGSSFDMVNQAGTTYASWCWDKNAVPGFDMVLYSGNGAVGRTINHNLGAPPKFMLIKSRNSADHWNTYHSSVGPTGLLQLNSWSSEIRDGTSGCWNNTAPTSAVITVNSGGPIGYTNQSGVNYIGYLWSEVTGFSRFGDYTGNGNTDGPFVYCGFKPRLVLIKAINQASTNWVIQDSASFPYNEVKGALIANRDDAEQGSSYEIDFLSNGFKARRGGGDTNASGTKYLFCAWAETPFKHSLAR
jgi:hypothetical protein